MPKKVSPITVILDLTSTAPQTSGEAIRWHAVPEQKSETGSQKRQPHVVVIDTSTEIAGNGPGLRLGLSNAQQKALNTSEKEREILEQATLNHTPSVGKTT